MFRPKGISFDSEGHLYVVDGQWGMVQVFDGQGRLLYYFGQREPDPEISNCRPDCRSTTTIAIYVVDSFNRRIEVFHYYVTAKSR